MRDFHFSEISKYLRCTVDHAYTYIERLESNKVRTAPSLGTIGHKVMQHLLRVHMWKEAFESGPTCSLDDVVNEYVSSFNGFDDGQEFRDRYQETVSAAQAACAWLLSNGWKPVLIEETLSTTIAVNDETVRIVGTVDLVLEGPHGDQWLVDNKFREKFRGAESEYFNLQMAMYQHLLNENGFNVVGSRQLQIYPYAQKTPKVNKDGSLSKADVMCDWDTYKAEVLKRDLNLDDYAQMEQKLSGKRFIDIDSLMAYRSSAEIYNTWMLVVVPAILRIMRNDPPIMVMDSSRCSRCDFKDLCVETLKGGDVDYFKRYMFHPAGTSPSDFRVTFSDEDE